MSGKITFYKSFGILRNQSIFVIELVEYNRSQLDASGSYRLEGQNRVVYRTETAVCGENERKLMVGDIIDGEVFVFDRNQKSACAFDEHTVVAAKQLVGSQFDNF